MKLHFLCVISLLLGIFHRAKAQENSPSDKGSSLSHVGIKAHYGFIFAHSRDVSNLANSYPSGIEFNLSKRLTSQKTWDQCHCFPHVGLIFSYFDYDNSIVGKSVTAAPYLEPVFKINPSIHFSVRGALGLSYLTHPYDALSNPANQSYSMPVGGYLALGTGFHIRTSDRLWFNMSAQYNHISNGGIKEPNKGLNYPTVAGGFHYYLEAPSLPNWPVQNNENSTKLNFRTEIYGSSKSILPGEKIRYFIGGFQLSAGKRIGLLNSLRAGAEWTFDYALQERLRRNGSNTKHFHRAGILLGHEFLMGKFLFSQHMGWYAYNPSGYNTLLYQRYSLLYKINSRWFTGFNLKAHGHVANFIDLRIGRSIN